jgi:hypothetical protein
LQQNIDELRGTRAKLSEKSISAYKQAKLLMAEIDMLVLLQQQDSDDKD